MNYIDDLAKRIAVHALCDWEHEESRNLMRFYALIGMVAPQGMVTNQDVHDAWAVWMLYRKREDHRCLVPFEELTPEDQAKDTFYRDAIYLALSEAQPLRDQARREG